MERGTLTLFLAAAVVIATTLALPAVREVVEIAGDRSPVRLLTETEIPVSSTSAGPAALSATYDSAWVVASGLSAGARWLLGAGAALSGLTAAITAGSVAFFLLLLMWRRTFHRALVVATLTAGATLLIGSLLSAGLGGLGRMMAADELNPVTGEVFVIGFAFDPGPLLAGIAVMCLSFIFNYGIRLQRDTEGLV
jgi:hypothetical protein